MNGTLTANGTVAVNIPVAPARATPLTLFAKGTWGSGTLKVQALPSGDAADALDITGVSLTGDGYKTLPLMQSGFLVVLTGATNPNLKWWLQ